MRPAATARPVPVRISSTSSSLAFAERHDIRFGRASAVRLEPVDVIALTGGIAAGKSTVARRWREHGAVIIDADALAREAVAPGSAGLEAIVERFGAEVLDEQVLTTFVWEETAEIVILLGLARRTARKSRKYHYFTEGA